jgi:hypothetical protein
LRLLHRRRLIDLPPERREGPQHSLYQERPRQQRIVGQLGKGLASGDRIAEKERKPTPT